MLNIQRYKLTYFRFKKLAPGGGQYRAAPGAAGAAVLLLLLLAGIMRSTAGNYTAFIYFQF